MDTAYISAFAALAGTAIGGLASFATSWVTQQAQTRAQRRAAERDARAALFGRFLDEAAKLSSDALQTSRDDVSGLIGIYALTNRIRLLSSPEVVEATGHCGSHHRRHLGPGPGRQSHGGWQPLRPDNSPALDRTNRNMNCSGDCVCGR